MQNELFNVENFIDVELAAIPFFQYPGGKRKLSNWIVSFFPKKVNVYYEPFLGAGAVFWEARKQNIADSYIISDVAPIIYCHYISIRDNFSEFLEYVYEHSRCHNKDYFYLCKNRLKHLKKNNIFTTETSSLDVYLKNQSLYSTGYTPLSYGKGEYRINRDSLYSCNKLLQNVTILKGDYQDIVKPDKDVLIYCDPPYSGTRQDVYEISTIWGGDDNVRLSENVLGWKSNNAKVIISSMIRGNVSVKENPLAKLLPSFETKEKGIAHTWGKLPQSQREDVREILLIS